MRTWLVAMILAGMTIPAQALDLPGFGKKKDGAPKEATESADKSSEPTAQEQKAPKTDAPFPIRITNADLSGDNLKFLETYLVVQNFQQKMQLPDGSMTTESGRVLVFQKGDTYIIGFYRPVDDAYVLMGQPVGLKDSGLPREDFHQAQNLPTIVAKRNDGQGMHRVFIQAGKTVHETAPDDTVTKPAEAPIK